MEYLRKYLFEILIFTLLYTFVFLVCDISKHPDRVDFYYLSGDVALSANPTPCVVAHHSRSFDISVVCSSNKDFLLDYLERANESIKEGTK